MADPAVRVRELVVARGGREVLHRVGTEVAGGQVTGLLGPSGGGKTTLLRCLVGVQRVRAGSVTVLGLPAGDARLRSRVGYVTQAPSVYADLTVRENVRYFAAVAGPGARGGVDEVLATVELTDRGADRVGRLSGGQRARVSLACALVGRPEVLVLDEPTVGLDPLLRRSLWGLFHRLAAAGTAVLVSSHVMDEAAHCDRLLLLRGGVLVADDTPEGIRAATGTQDLDEAFVRLAGSTGAASTGPVAS